MAETVRAKEVKVKTLINWLAVLLLVGFVLSLHSYTDTLSINAFPTVAKEGEPTLITFTLRNFDVIEKPYKFEFYINGEKVLDGKTELKPFSSQPYQYSYESQLKLGEQANFMVRAITPSNIYEEVLSTPSYPPQVWTSFVSFASFSTSIAGFSSFMGLTSMASYKDTFGAGNALNVGLVFTLVLIPLLVFSVLAEPYARRGILGRLKPRFDRLSTILFVIFMAMVLTQIVMIVGRMI